MAGGKERDGGWDGMWVGGGVREAGGQNKTKITFLDKIYFVVTIFTLVLF